MDRELSQKQEIERLIRLAEIARTRLGNDAHALVERLDVVSRVRNSLKTHPKGWILGGLASGYVASIFLRRRPAAAAKTIKNRNWALTLLGLTLTAVRPLAKVWLTEQLGSYLTGRSGVLQPKSPRPAQPSSNSI
jgi:hypothetical protein